MASAAEGYARLVAALRQQADLAAALHLLEWDQETFMPFGAGQGRARQIGTLAALLHEQQTAPGFLELVDELAERLSELDPQQAVDVRETKWHLDRERRLDAALVRERSTVHAQGQVVWITARRDDDFAALAPWLGRIIEIERRVAGAIDASRDPYDVLLEEYEPDTSAAVIESLFRELRQGLLPLVNRLRVRLAARPLPVGALCGDFPVAAQRQFNRLVAECLGFDFNRGRLDETAHPFTTSIGDDVRITTRYDARDLRYSLYSTIHETGHALYEQGLDPEAWGTPRGESCSFGIHESQSRLWENQVGRSQAFWQRLLPQARELFPALAGVSAEAAALAANEARPSLIRTEADEITYNLHIILRFELERALLAGAIDVRTLPQIWREKMREYLGVSPDTDREGVLQDVHWFGGAIGYFPSYALGNIYAAQLLRAAEADIGPVDAVVAAGEFHLLLDWLRKHVHRLGQTHRPAELIRIATGAPPNPGPLFEHLERKLAFIEAAQPGNY
jgi:carboxypeptidase Taq